MPPRSRKITVADSVPDCDTMEDTLKGILSELASIKAKLCKVDSMEEKLDNLQRTLDEMKVENGQLKQENEALKLDLVSKEQSISSLQLGLDSLERHNRSYSVRITGVPLTDREERDPLQTMQKIYDVLFLPILRGAHQDGALHVIPGFDQLFETAHVLPGKNGSHKPIIARFYNRNLKSICFRYRKDHAPRESNVGVSGRGATASEGSERAARLRFPFHDDLTRPALFLLKALQGHEKVQACWSINGQLRYKLKNSDTVKKVKSVFDHVDDILS